MHAYVQVVNAYTGIKELYLNDMVSEISLFSFFSSSVFDIKNANKISSPTSHQSIEDLKQDP